MTKFNFKKGSATKKGKLQSKRVLTPDHVLFPFYYESITVGNKVQHTRRKPEETKRLIAETKQKLKPKEEDEKTEQNNRARQAFIKATQGKEL